MGCVFCTLFEEKCILVSPAFRIACLRRFSHSFYTATALSVSLRSPRSPRGEGFCAGDSVYVPSFLWKEVPRRGGGWLP